MYKTSFGVFEGKSWEALCQLVFKRKYGVDGYLQICPSPGDFGLEGYTANTGLGFQCYCPEQQYSRKELYEKQRDKITTDLAKLERNCNDLQALLGGTKLKNWVFVSPDIASHALLRHAKKKESEIVKLGLPIIDKNFKILLHDADHYMIEISQIQSGKGQAFDFNLEPPSLDVLSEPQEIYEKNIERKCEARLEHLQGNASYDKKFAILYESVLQSFIEADPHLRRIEEISPSLHFRLVRLINEYAVSVKEKAVTWQGSAEDLTQQVTNGLVARLVKDLHPDIDETSASQIARHIISRWLASCQLDYA